MDEQYIREFKEAVSGDRLSCHSFNANRMRIFLHVAAYILMHSIRENGLKGTSLEKATLLEIRGRILLTAVNIPLPATIMQLSQKKRETACTYNIFIGNSDDHFRNHGFLLTPKGWTQSPAYDMNPTLSEYQSLLINESSNKAEMDMFKERFKLNL